MPKGLHVNVLEIFPLADTATGAEFPMTGVFPYRSFQESMYIFTQLKHDAFWKMKYTGTILAQGDL